jgi:predicted dehydrogenase
MSSPSSFSRRSFLKTLGAAALATPFLTRGLMARSPNGTLHHASFGADGMAWEDLTQLTKVSPVKLVAVADVDLNRTEKVRKKFPDAKIYQDWRELLDKEGRNLDSVNVSTPDHMHAPIAMSAMQLGKHVYCQKPLTHDLFEVRKLSEFARHKRVVTQMGIQIHSTNHYRAAARLLQTHVIGKATEVHSWCTRGWGDPDPQPDRSDPIPAGFDWNLWLGVCQPRPFLGNHYYHPSNWRKRLDFGTGSLGDMGCHIFDPVFMGLGLGAPLTARSEGPAPNPWNWALNSRVHYTFPGTPHTAAKTLPLTWYDGNQKLPREVLARLEGDDAPETGSIVVGTEGAMVIPHVSRPLLYPDGKFKDFKYPTLAGDDHWALFVQACLGNYPTSAHFGYASLLTEAVLVGAVATHFPQTTLNWKSSKLAFDHPEASRLVRRDYRAGWKVKGLS